ncbi:MAG: ATP-binding protein [Neobacillus sp.]
MKIDKYLKTSLAKQFSVLTMTIILAFSLLTTILLVYQNEQQQEFEATNEKLAQKDILASELDYAFNMAISEMRAYFAYKGEPTYFQRVQDQEQIVQEKLADLKRMADSPEDFVFIEHTEEFYNYYFFNNMPTSKQLYDSGNFDEVARIAVNQNGSKTIRAYQGSLKDYTDKLNQQSLEIQEQQTRKTLISQLVFAAILFVLIGGMGLLTRITLRRIGRPLKNLTVAASEIADGQSVLFTDTTNRQDELGLLSKAFEKMSKSIQEKEQDLLRLIEQSEGERLLTQNILDTIKEGILLVDPTGRVIQVNEKMCDLIGSSPSEIIDKKYGEWIEELANSTNDGAEVTKFFEQILFHGKVSEQSMVYHQQAPAERVIQVYCEVLERDGKKIGTVMVHRDISKEYEVDLMKSEFVSTVSHELRTPLASVLGFTELILNKELKPERQKKYLTTIYQEAKRLTALINDFLDVQRMEAGKQTYEKKYVDVAPILEDIIETYQLNNPTHEIHLERGTDQTTVYGDKDKLAQVFNNILSNAIKYSPNGGNIFVHLFADGSQLKIAIKDEGLGIPADALDKLFTKFYRVDNSDRRKIGGTGLGLAIVKEIVKAHEGDITAESAPGDGSVFTIIFPLVVGITKVVHELNPQDIPNQAGKVNVVVVEDDISHANLLQTELQESNFHVKVFSNAESALAAVKVEHPDVIVLDIMLGENTMTGWDFIKHVKTIDELKRIPIFISSALDDKEKGMALGANEYLIKPYPPSKLSKFIFQTLLEKDLNGQIHIPSQNED